MVHLTCRPCPEARRRARFRSSPFARSQPMRRELARRPVARRRLLNRGTLRKGGKDDVTRPDPIKDVPAHALYDSGAACHGLGQRSFRTAPSNTAITTATCRRVSRAMRCTEQHMNQTTPDEAADVTIVLSDAEVVDASGKAMRFELRRRWRQRRHHQLRLHELHDYLSAACRHLRGGAGETRRSPGTRYPDDYRQHRSDRGHAGTHERDGRQVPCAAGLDVDHRCRGARSTEY